jgi:hypothetical protein
VTSGIMFLLFSTIGFFIDQSIPAPIWFTIGWVTLALILIFSFFRFAVLLFRLLKKA